LNIWITSLFCCCLLIGQQQGIQLAINCINYPHVFLLGVTAYFGVPGLIWSNSYWKEGLIVLVVASVAVAVSVLIITASARCGLWLHMWHGLVYLQYVFATTLESHKNGWNDLRSILDVDSPGSRNRVLDWDTYGCYLANNVEQFLLISYVGCH